MLKELIKELNKAANLSKAKILAGFFKTGQGEYGEGDVFMGIIVPKQREIARKYLALSLNDIQKLLNSKFHEFRLVALIILAHKYQKAHDQSKKEIVNLYLKNAKRSRINNWDLVDLSAPKILGDYLFDKKKDILYTLCKSNNLWQRRISILATAYFISQRRFTEALKISKKLISDEEDLIHKAVGWMLREIGKRDLKTEINFLNKNYKKMPRTMLRYAIEKFNNKLRLKYLQK